MFLALSIFGVVYFVTDVLFRVWAASLVTAIVAGWFGWFWYGLPLVRKLDGRHGDGPSASSS